jgi:hypothetical protein
LCCLPLSVSVPVFLRDFPIMVSNQQLLANLGLMVILALGVLLLPPCGQRRSLGLFGYALCYVEGDLIGCGT